VRKDEEAALKRNAKTLDNLEPTKVAEIVQSQWGTEKGQDEILKWMEFMDKDAVNSVISELPTAMAQDLLRKRLRVGKEASTATPSR
jgi:dsDNA-specific endonuclease/ATPase MutS2